MDILKARFRLWLRDQRGQDLIEYAMLAGFAAVGVAAFFPNLIAPSITTLMGKLATVLVSAANPAG